MAVRTCVNEQWLQIKLVSLLPSNTDANGHHVRLDMEINGGKSLYFPPRVTVMETICDGKAWATPRGIVSFFLTIFFLLRLMRLQMMIKLMPFSSDLILLVKLFFSDLHAFNFSFRYGWISIFCFYHDNRQRAFLVHICELFC